MLRFVVLFAALAYAAADGGYGSGPHGGGGGGYKSAPRPYSYSYAVKDDYAGTNFNANEKSDGANVKGSYQVHLPDGRVQTVTYTADHYSGYVADVKYDGKASYGPSSGGGGYKPAPPSYGHSRY